MWPVWKIKWIKRPCRFRHKKVWTTSICCGRTKYLNQRKCFLFFHLNVHVCWYIIPNLLYVFIIHIFFEYCVICKSLDARDRAGANHNAQWYSEFLFHYRVLFIYFNTYEISYFSYIDKSVIVKWKAIQYWIWLLSRMSTEKKSKIEKQVYVLPQITTLSPFY